MRTQLKFCAATSQFLFAFVCSVPVWARGGGGGGGHGGGGHGGYHGGYGHRFSGSGAVDTVVIIFLLAFVFVGIVIVFSQALNDKKKLVNVVLILRNGDEYSNALDEFSQRGNFASAQKRTGALREPLSYIRTADIFRGFVAASAFNSTSRQAENAKGLWDAQMRQVDVQPQLLNLSVRGRRTKTGAATPTNTALADAQNLCLVSLIVTLPDKENSSFDNDMRFALDRFYEENVDAFYFFYTPHFGESLSSTEATELCRNLREKNVGFFTAV